MTLLRRLRLVTVAILFSSASYAAAAPGAAKASVEAKATAAKSGLTLSFRVVPAAGLHINQEGPWQLELKSAPGLSFASTTLKKSAVDFALPGFVVTTTAAPTQATGSVSYKLTAFVCTDDKAQCFRDVLSGDLGWQR